MNTCGSRFCDTCLLDKRYGGRRSYYPSLIISLIAITVVLLSVIMGMGVKSVRTAVLIGKYQELSDKQGELIGLLKEVNFEQICIE